MPHASVDRRPGEFSFIAPVGAAVLGETVPWFQVSGKVFPLRAFFDWDIAALVVTGTAHHDDADSRNRARMVRPVDHQAAVAEWHRRFPGKALPQTFAEIMHLRGESGDHRWGQALTSEARGEQVRRTMETLRNRTAALQL